MLCPKGANRARKDWIKKGPELRSIRARASEAGYREPQAEYQIPEGSSQGVGQRLIRRWCVYGRGESEEEQLSQGGAPRSGGGSQLPRIAD